MPTLVSQLIEDTRRHLYGTSRLSLNRLAAGNINDTVTTITIEFDVKDIVRGALISIDDELMWVIDSNPAAKTATVIRGYLGTTAAAHNLGSIIEVNPRFPRPYIKRALQQEIDSWGTKLFKVVTANIPFTNSTRIYDLVGLTNFIYIFDARMSSYVGRTTRANPYRWTVLRDMDVAEFPSGSAIELLGDYPNSGTLRVKAAIEFDVSTWTDNTDVESLGLASSMTDIPPIGAAWRLMSAKEVGRTNLTAQPEPRKAEEVPAGHIASVAAQLKKLRDDRIDEERWTLMQRYPLKGVA